MKAKIIIKDTDIAISADLFFKPPEEVSKSSFSMPEPLEFFGHGFLVSGRNLWDLDLVFEAEIHTHDGVVSGAFSMVSIVNTGLPDEENPMYDFAFHSSGAISYTAAVPC